MILTIAGANFEGANIGQNKNVTITLTKGNGVSGSKVSSLTLEKNQVVSTATVIATGLSLQTGYKDLVVTVTMAGTGDVNDWFSNANGTVTIPSETKITGNIKITARATATSTGGGNAGGDTTMYTFTINPTPSNATVTLTASDYSQSGKSITVPANTSVSWKVEATDYETQSGTETINSDLNKSVILSQSTTGGENGIYPIGQVLDSGTVSTNTTALLPSCTTKDILECGGIYEITITPSYSGNCSLYLGGKTGSQYCLKQQTGVVANTPFTLTFNVPYLNYLDKEKVELNKVWFRSYQSTECTFTYSIKKTGYNNNPLEGVAIFKDSTISATGQRVYGFEAGCTYDYEITPSYTGTMTIYQAYSNAGVSTGSVENIGAMSIASVTANTPIKGTITILETPSVTEATLGRLPDTLILRSHQSVEVSIQYKFTKK